MYFWSAVVKPAPVSQRPFIFILEMLKSIIGRPPRVLSACVGNFAFRREPPMLGKLEPEILF